MIFRRIGGIGSTILGLGELTSSPDGLSRARSNANIGYRNDPREGGVGRKFNPVKQASDYDPKAEYIRAWVPEVRGTDSVEEAWQCWKVPVGRRKALGLEGYIGAEHPLVRIEYRMGRGGGQRRGGGGGGGGPGPGSARGGRGARGGRDRGNGRDGFSKRDML